MIQVEAYFDDPTNTVTYLVEDVATKHAVLIDPVLDYEPHRAALTTASVDRILSDIRARKLELTWVLDTHAHADHLSAADYVRTETGAKMGIGARITDVQKLFGPVFNARDVCANGSVFDALFEDGDEIPLGSTSIKVLHTPGHTPACVTFIIGDAAFVGDTLFMPDYGTARADFPGGDARTLHQSIQKILSLPPETRIFVGHDYSPESRNHVAWESTVAEQLASNVHLDGSDENAFVAMREARDATLKAPRLILPSLQVNIRGGALPPAESDGHTYLKLPINRI
ncbi:MBL fold metallo-hydrolase [Parvularcula sp. IMCC14364]|uniref:MBL fold metallo-hydrolase n=1 Tax=Parvularcula sp. IMCC14364 TaxID=3067902 RepID=UPI0027403B87|nr:MBL fold metallo-hydrolase [Parvularcula sp. IMCC14364]